MADGDRQFVTTSTALPTLLDDGLNRPMRGSKYGEPVAQILGKAAYAYADEGSYFVARNPTVGTGIAGIAAADGPEGLENLLYIENGHASKRIYLDYLRLEVTAAGTNGTTTVFISATSPTARYTSGGSTITPVSTNLGAGVASSAVVRFGALVTTAVPAAGAVVGGGKLRNGVITVVGDQYTFDFGGYQCDMPTLILNGTAQGFVTIRHAPVVLDPGHCFTLEVYAASQSAASSFEFQLGYIER